MFRLGVSSRAKRMQGAAVAWGWQFGVAMPGTNEGLLCGRRQELGPSEWRQSLRGLPHCLSPGWARVPLSEPSGQAVVGGEWSVREVCLLCSPGDSGKVTTVVATLGQGPERSQEVAYTDIKVIGNGSFGVVYQARLAETRELVAIKKVLQDKRFKVPWVRVGAEKV